MATILYGTTANNAVPTVDGTTDLTTAGNAAQFIIWNTALEPVKMTISDDHALVTSKIVRRIHDSNHTDLMNDIALENGVVLVNPEEAILVQVTVVTPDADDAGNNTVTFTASALHTEAGLDGNIIYVLPESSVRDAI